MVIYLKFLIKLIFCKKGMIFDINQHNCPHPWIETSQRTVTDTKGGEGKDGYGYDQQLWLERVWFG